MLPLSGEMPEVISNPWFVNSVASHILIQCVVTAMGVAERRRVAMRLPCNTFCKLMLFTNHVCICFHVVVAKQISLSLSISLSLIWEVGDH